MQILERFIKQPADVQDYDIDFTEYLDDLGDTILSHVVEVELGLTITASVVLAGNKVVKVWVSGGADGASYKVTVRVTTVGGRVKEVDVLVRVKQI